MKLPPITVNEIAAISALAERACGVTFAADKAYLLEARLGPLAQSLGCESYLDYLNLIGKSSWGPLLDQFLDAVTTHETLWFRDAGPWVVLQERLWPSIFATLAKQPVGIARILFVACSTGQEPYSLVMHLHEFAKKVGRPDILPRIEILATDVSQLSLVGAAAGRYDDFSTRRGLSETLRDQYMKKQGQYWCVNDAIRKRVRFVQHNVLESLAAFGRFDIVFCRNVLIYFNAATKRTACARLANALKDDGVLFVGSSESLHDMPGLFRVEAVGPHTFYRPAIVKPVPVGQANPKR